MSLIPPLQMVARVGYTAARAIAARGAMTGAAAGGLAAGVVTLNRGDTDLSSPNVDAQTDQQQSTDVSTFADGDADMSKLTMPVRDNPMPDVKHDIYEFLANPIKVQDFDWLVGTEPIDFDPWDLFFSHPTVVRKIANYALVSAKLRVRIVCNGNPYQFGRATYGYLPDPVTDVYRAQTAGLTGFAISNLPMQFNVEANKNSVIEMEVPWLKRRETNINESKTSGSFVSFVPAPLGTVSVGLLEPFVTINIYVSAVDVKLQHRTQVQPLSDYTGVLSKPLQTASQTLASFSKVPTIGKYADVFSTVAKAGADLTTLFGFSAPNNIRDICPSTVKPFGNLSSTMVQDAGDVLATDPRATTIMDPDLLGIPPLDEMVINELAQRYSLVDAFDWTDLQGGDTYIKTIQVSPHYNSQSLPFAPSHVSYHTLPFAYFRGSLNWKIVIPATTFHSGRLQIAFEPLNYGAQEATDMTNVLQNVVLDLKESNELVFNTPFTSPYWAEDNVTTYTNFNNLISDTLNGHLKFRVVSQLRAGGVTTTLKVLVYLAAGPDWEVMCPTFSAMFSKTKQLRFSPQGTVTGTSFTEMTGQTYTPISPGLLIAEEAEEEEPGSTIVTPTSLDVMNNEALFTATNYSELVASERILSWRSLVKRYCPGAPAILPPSKGGFMACAVPDLPMSPGVARASPTGNLYNTFETYNFLNYLSPCYFAYRGGVRHKFIDVNGITNNLQIMRVEYALLPTDVYGFAEHTGPAVSAVENVYQACGSTIVQSGLGGVEATIPFRARVYAIKTSSARSPVTGLTSSILSAYIKPVEGASSWPPNPIQHYVAAGDDFTFLFYLGPPVLYEWTFA
jgi:hypothetical protein